MDNLRHSGVVNRNPRTRSRVSKHTEASDIAVDFIYAYVKLLTYIQYV